MTGLLRTLAAVLLAGIVAACAGTDFQRVSESDLVLNRTTEQEIEARLAAPFQQGVVVKNGKEIKSKSFAYAHSMGSSVQKDIVASRSQTFYFHDGRLVGYGFASTWREDSSDFDETKVPQIEKGKSTYADVVRLLGQPGGRQVYPMTDSPDEQNVTYRFSQVNGRGNKMKIFAKSLTVTLDKRDVVIGVDYKEEGTK